MWYLDSMFTLLLNQKSNIIKLGIFCMLFTACQRHYIRPLPAIEENRVINKKIATIGFYPYAYSSYTSGRTVTTTALLDYSNPTTKLVSLGKPIDEIEVTGINSNVSPEKVKTFILDYLGKVKKSGSREIEKLVEVRGKGDSATFHLKNRDVDFYILGIHGPAFDEEGSAGNLGRLLLTGHLFMFSLGTTPLWSTKPADTDILVYDKDLNLVYQKSYKSRYTLLTAWWGNENEGYINKKNVPEFTPKLYEPDLRDFYNELPTILNPLK